MSSPEAWIVRLLDLFYVSPGLRIELDPLHARMHDSAHFDGVIASFPTVALALKGRQRHACEPVESEADRDALRVRDSNIYEVRVEPGIDCRRVVLCLPFVA